jgi:outer membrane PBP1 activator LpoA protein
MMKTTMALVAVATFAGAVPAAAMQDAGVQLAAAVTPPVDRAAVLRAEAEELFSQPRRWSRAASLLERSAEIGGMTDANSFGSLLLAGRLRANTRDYAAAYQNLEKAGEHALARGAVLDAAHAFIDAAHVAAADGNRKNARAMVERAKLLAESPLLTSVQAEQVTRRIGDA